MDKKLKYDVGYMQMAMVWAGFSHAERKKVGAVLVRDDNVISGGFNGTPHGYDNVCEIDGVTRWETLHAELNVIIKCARMGFATKDSTLYVTCSPCRDCSKLIAQAGIARVVYFEEYRDLAGIEMLRNLGVSVEKIEIADEQAN